MKITVCEKTYDAIRAATVEFDGKSANEMVAVNEFFNIYFNGPDPEDEEEEDDD